MPSLALAQPEGLARGDDVEPAEDRRPGGLGSEHERPRVLAGVLDQLAWRVDRVRDGTAQVVVMAAVELVLVAAQGGPCCRLCRFGRGLHEPRSG